MFDDDESIDDVPYRQTNGKKVRRKGYFYFYLFFLAALFLFVHKSRETELNVYIYINERGYLPELPSFEE